MERMQGLEPVNLRLVDRVFYSSARMRHKKHNADMSPMETLHTVGANDKCRKTGCKICC